MAIGIQPARQFGAVLTASFLAKLQLPNAKPLSNIRTLDGREFVNRFLLTFFGNENTSRVIFTADFQSSGLPI